MNGFVDLHCHILPKVDDGPESVETAVELVLGLQELGFAEFYPTPHQKPGSWMPTAEETLDATEALRAALASAGSDARIHDPAGENMWGDRLLDLETRAFPTYPGGQAFLLEFTPFAVPLHLRDHFYAFRQSGCLPVVAHVERFPEITNNKERLDALAAGGALLLNIPSLAGWWSSREARRLVRDGWVHALASDAHGVADLDGCRRGMEWVRNKLGEELLERLLGDNPRQILAGMIPEP